MSIILFLFFMCFSPNEATLTIATTTSVEDTGLLEVLLPPFEKHYDIKVKYIAVGTGQALRLARDGNADLIFVHDKEREEDFIKQGYGTHRHEVMQNYFLIVGPEKNVEALEHKPLCDILGSIASNEFLFISRGDESGTHSREKLLWKTCKVLPSGEWYLESGSGMISTLRIANEKQAFALTDTATFLSHRDELQLHSYTEKDSLLLNIYSIIPVNPDKYPHVCIKEAEKFISYILKGEGGTIIKNFGKERYGKPLFQMMWKP
ncbi:MAG: hypothetical protein A2Y62_16925 [Candidatus Fischerbacteria bacterium RBG_13_37_8]|uniref:PBP domain-containing protein n=1 Tax=Candidatus Fischerbacteria bacterium RBG_13_37_8 TaxID=1817863 RepID=A0A1F5VDR9_9BACT|nr:MAG: hypothetical protein A2Y62_16925 [Candidatus Fischerbacteria bacterium RBG_13_37_8]